jgi:hypothetical protein
MGGLHDQKHLPVITKGAGLRHSQSAPFGLILARFGLTVNFSHALSYLFWRLEKLLILRQAQRLRRRQTVRCSARPVCRQLIRPPLTPPNTGRITP